MVTTRSAAQKSADAAEMVSENDPSQNGHLDGCNINKEDIKYVSICMNIFLLFLSDYKLPNGSASSVFLHY